MCHSTCIAFGQRVLKPDDIRGKRVIEVGSANINGSLRSWVESQSPQSYVGVDIAFAPGVDEICAAEDLISRFGKESFDVVICTEVLEHVSDWRGTVSNIKNVLKSGGVLLVTTRSVGFPCHGFPHDFWRYDLNDGRTIFSDLTIELLEKDTPPGIFLLARKPVKFAEVDLCAHALYSMISGRRCVKIPAGDMLAFRCRWSLVSLAAKLRRLRSLLARPLPAPLKFYLKRKLGLSQAPESRTRDEVAGLMSPKSSDFCREVAPLVCPCCGANEFKEQTVLWRELVEQWRLVDHEAAYINRQQGLRCVCCGANLRSMALAGAIMKCYGFRGNFTGFLKSEATRELRVLEINEAGSLNPLLAQLPKHVLSRYPQVDMMALPFEEGAFDLVLHSDTLEHVPRPVQALSECRRVLAPGGFCVFTVPIIVDRLTLSREGLPLSFHGSPCNPDDHIVCFEYGADAWKYLILAGFSECRIHSLEYPAAQALVGVR